MIHKLKRKFILINMSIIFAVLSLMLILVLSSSDFRFKKSYETALLSEMNLAKPGSRRFSREPQGSSDKVSFTVHLEQNSWKLLTPWLDIDEDDLHELIERANMETNDTGFWQDEGIAYQKRDNRIAYVNMESEYERHMSNKTTWIVVYVAVLVIFAFISVFLAQWAIRPVKKAWQNQKSFISDASHELKTPLTVILANLEIAMQNGGESKWLGVAKAEAEHMKKLIDNLLFLARSDENMHLSNTKRIHFSQLLQELTLAFDAIAFENKLILEEHIENDIYVQGDTDLLRQLISILLENAIKYTPKNNRICVRLSGKQDTLKLSVQNRGSVISQEKLERLFERFYRLDEARTKGGYGLGLSIAQKITLLHGGTIKASSSETEGTIFTVILNKA